MLYRDVKYTYKEWKTYNGKQASAYYCSDPILLKEYGTIEFGAKTLDEMHEKIDYYLDNAEYQEAISEGLRKAAQEFYSQMGEYKGD